jgi:DNA invertase Pin-like site-specific DNA recombinase
VRAFVADPAQLLTEYFEIESGKKNHQPQLLAAIAEARRTGATLLIAKLDRLSRNAGFIFALRDSGVDFVCCDMPDANTLTVGLFAVIAQHEREMISKRTTDALTAKTKGCFVVLRSFSSLAPLEDYARCAVAG